MAPVLVEELSVVLGKGLMDDVHLALPPSFTNPHGSFITS